MSTPYISKISDFLTLRIIISNKALVNKNNNDTHFAYLN